ncbi:putative DNA-binding domain-containing protein [Sulfitobacter aestuarii]|uniref:DNA-binding domain-containing protein n=1 Tax=Sulfitobacter aestuarii TaxID=2161676 RepID=A0ABW5TZS6_9RHOB
MSSLSAFRAALLDPEQPVPDGLLDGAARPAGRRYAVYRNNVTRSLIDALETGFPLLRKLVGAQNFRRLASLYVRAHPPRSPLMMFYGEALPIFLEDFAPLRHIGYLPDAARLDLALRDSYHAADSAPLDPARLAAVAPETLPALRLPLRPATRIIHSRWPLFDIWRYNFTKDAPKLRAEAQDVLITRPEFDPAPHLMPPGMAAFLTACARGKTLGEAQEAGLTGAAGFDLEAALGLALTSSAFAVMADGDTTAGNGGDRV